MYGERRACYCGSLPPSPSIGLSTLASKCVSAPWVRSADTFVQLTASITTVFERAQQALLYVKQQGQWLGRSLWL